uniref:NADH-ubiquinone oxidoreductase chain 1 n=1 Tax=Dunaliella viridis TaxID=140095 RepID=A0A0C5C464_9CHLO|nr:NADH dehydrogenase subunit 1 [Dunaliella viridis]AJN90457.1 NADH dehydrogenase subunit 1 [Dunaliella viridis]
MILLTILTITVPILLVVAFTTLFERQVMASMQRRMGPQTSGIGGLLQPFYDGLKLGIKEPILPELSASGAFSVAPMIAFILSQVSFSIIFISDSSYQGIILMALSSLAVYGVLLAGWASNSKYAFLGALRSVALMVSYELGFGAVLLSICLFLTDSTGMKSLNFADAPSFMQLALLPLLIIFLITILAESKRIPFDLPEAEAELVAGFNVEYSSLGFALFFIAEYANLTILSAIASIYFLGGFSALKIITLIFGFVWVRGTLPRYRADSFMQAGWKALLPLSLSLFGFYAAFDYIF